MNKILHSVDKWFGSKKELLNYFENLWTKNSLGTFKAPRSIIANFNNLQTTQDKENCIGVIAEIYITSITTSSMGAKLRKIPWEWLEEDTRYYLKDGLLNAVIHAVRNNQIWERINASTVNLGSTQITQDTTNWLISNDVFGIFAKQSITASGINHYEWWEEGMLIADAKNGNIRKVVGKADLETLKELTL